VERQLIEQYVATGQVRLEYHHFIVVDGNVGGNESRHAAEASECANEQGRFWDYHAMLFANQEGEGRDWTLTDGKEVRITYDRKIIKPGSDPSISKIVDATMRLYENVIKDFSIQYPKDWYYRSFGAIEGKIWAVGFSDKPFERYADTVVYLVIDTGESTGKSEIKGDRYRIEKSRDATTHFALNGPLGMKGQLDAMAESLTQN